MKYYIHPTGVIDFREIAAVNREKADGPTIIIFKGACCSMNVANSGDFIEKFQAWAAGQNGEPDQSEVVARLLTGITGQ